VDDSGRTLPYMKRGVWYEGNVHDTDAKSVTMPNGDSGALGNKEGRATLVGRYTCAK